MQLSIRVSGKWIQPLDDSEIERLQDLTSRMQLSNKLSNNGYNLRTIPDINRLRGLVWISSGLFLPIPEPSYCIFSQDESEWIIQSG